MPQVPFSHWVAKCEQHKLDPYEAAKLLGLDAKRWSNGLLSAYLPALDGIMWRDIRRENRRLKRILDRRTLALETVTAERDELKAALDVVQDGQFWRDYFDGVKELAAQLRSTLTLTDDYVLKHQPTR
jgi:hypothetical protein